jgi:quercetin dioxygenase-like cupin family protein
MVEIVEGERITEGDVSVTLLADIEEIGIAETRSRPYCDDPWPPLHAHAEHAEIRFVLEGELTLRLENGEHRVGPETWVFIPPEVVHTIGVTGDQPARFLQLHVPNSGFGDAVRGLRSAFDMHPIPEYASADPELVVIRRPAGASGVGSTEPPRSGGAGLAGAEAETGEKITDRPGRRVTLLVDADEATITEFAYGPGERGAALHVHRDHTDAFLVVDGEFTLHLREGTLAAPAGTLVLFPPNVVHGFDNSGEAEARCFNLHLPASGFADYLRGRNPDFDQHEPPADGGADPASIVAVRLG